MNLSTEDFQLVNNGAYFKHPISMFVYILFSESLDRFYVGQTNDLEKRMKQHMNQFFPFSYKKRAIDWKLFAVIQCDSTAQAIRIEKHIKSMKSTSYILNLEKYPELKEKLKSRFK